MTDPVTDQKPLNVLDEDTLIETLTERRLLGDVIVTTNGCFDVLHVGHLRYLQAARELGNALVVLINSDSSVRALKGPQRPIVPEDERAELLAGLDCVDYVAIFNHDTPVELLQRIRPNIHVKGGDYTAGTLPEAPILEGMGTVMAFIPTIPGRSTTDIVRRIREGTA